MKKEIKELLLEEDKKLDNIILGGEESYRDNITFGQYLAININQCLLMAMFSAGAVMINTLIFGPDSLTNPLFFAATVTGLTDIMEYTMSDVNKSIYKKHLKNTLANDPGTFIGTYIGYVLGASIIS